MANCEHVAPLEALWLCKMQLPAEQWARLSVEQKARAVMKMAMADKLLLPTPAIRSTIGRIDAFVAASPPAGRIAVAEETCPLPSTASAASASPPTDNRSESTGVQDLRASLPTPGAAGPQRSQLMSFLVPAGIGALLMYGYLRYRRQRTR